ncbi:ricin-type beta-trefoil lectin domain protein [Streptomyces sp. NPDC057757]|uniref:ricin-type beta-trefoil lectin domain protein n=1 Tax=Streptomyces sp. NPDC057757 TaxID=3346241 RepID=UPI0036BAB545
MPELPKRDVTGHLGAQPLGPDRNNDAATLDSARAALARAVAAHRAESAGSDAGSEGGSEGGPDATGQQRLADSDAPRTSEESADEPTDGSAGSSPWAFRRRGRWILAAALGAAVGIVVAGVVGTAGGGPNSSGGQAEPPAEGVLRSGSGDAGLGDRSPQPGVPDAALVTPPSAVPSSSPGKDTQDSPEPSKSGASAGSGATPTAQGPDSGADSGPTAAPGGALVVEAAGKCLTGAGQGSELVVSACDGSADQSWSSGPAGSLRQGGLCATVTGTEDRTPIALAACDQSSAQQIALTGGALVSEPQGKCLDLFGGASGTRVVLWECNGRDNQHWSAA